MRRSAAILTIMFAAIIGFGIIAPASTTAQGRPTFDLPPQAKPIAPGVFFLGTAIADGVEVEGYAFVHPAAGAAKAQAARGKPGGGEASCYSFISGGKWKTAEPWEFNNANSHLIAPTVADMKGTLDAWDTQVAASIFGAGTLTGATLSVETSAPDGRNEVYFASISSSGTIAVTTVWTTRIGKEIVEWDMVFDDDAEWNWSSPLGMQFLNIATHEAGHAAGMGHTNTSATCAAQTMYPYASFGETSKTTLELGDRTGIKALYP